MHELQMPPISMTEISKAHRILKNHHRPTPLRRVESLCRCLDAEIHVKMENLNPTGTFKIRGGLNLMHHLKEAGIRGVITYSTGNHGTSIATAARHFGLEAVIVVPEGSNPIKLELIRRAGAELIVHGANFEEAGRRVQELVQERGLYFAHPANDSFLINGVATVFLEILEELPELEVLVIPIGAGSESAAAITIARALRPQLEIIAVQSAASPAASESWKAGRIVEAENRTFAGGIATGIAYEVPFELYRDGLKDFLVLSEDQLFEGMALAAHHTHTIVEGAGGASLRAAFEKRSSLRGKTVAIQFSGANASPKELRRAYALECLETGDVD